MKWIEYYAKILVRLLRATFIRIKNGVDKRSFGKENPEKTIYIIKRDDPRVGLFSYFIINLGQIKYAVEKGYVPVIDMMNYPNSYLAPEKMGVENSWEYYFKQPCGISLEDAYKSKNVIVSSFGPWDWPSDTPVLFEKDSVVLAKWRKYIQKYIHLSDEVKKQVEAEYNRLFAPDERVLGIKCRGTDYLALEPKGHPRQPDVSVVIEKAHEVIKKYKIDKVFIATEDEDIEKCFEKEFGSILVKSQQTRREYDGIHYISEMRGTRENDQYLDGLEYLVTILLLARCNCFISGRNSGAVGVMLFSDGFEYKHVWDLGNY